MGHGRGRGREGGRWVDGKDRRGERRVEQEQPVKNASKKGRVALVSLAADGNFLRTAGTSAGQELGFPCPPGWGWRIAAAPHLRT
eukprot:765263-Hanusia_phi.AAC.4